MTDHAPHRPSFARLALAGAALLALAACGSEPGGAPDGVATLPAATAGDAPAGPAVAAAGPAAAAPAGQQSITMAECGTPAEGRVHFRVGEAVFAVPAEMVRDAVPAGVQPPLRQEVVTAELRAQTSQGAGCPEKPLDTTLLMLGGDLGDPLLAGGLGILRSTPGMITGQFAQLTRELQRNPTDNCRTLNGQLIACVGTETLAQRETPVMYVITTDPNRNLNTGGPLAARCVLEGQQIRGCNIVDQVPGNVTIDATLNPGTYSTESLASAHRAAVASVEALRR